MERLERVIVVSSLRVRGLLSVPNFETSLMFCGNVESPVTKLNILTVCGKALKSTLLKIMLNLYVIEFIRFFCFRQVRHKKLSSLLNSSFEHIELQISRINFEFLKFDRINNILSFSQNVQNVLSGHTGGERKHLYNHKRHCHK